MGTRDRSDWGGETDVFRDYRIQAQPSLRFTDEEGVRALHRAALRILERTGVVIHHEGVVEMLAEAGCQVADTKRVRIPEHLVEEAIRSTPKSVAVYNRKGDPALLLEGRRSYWGTGSDTPFTLDYKTGQRRRTNLEDIEHFAVVVDALNNMDFLMCMGVAHELSPAIADKHHFVTMVSNTIKPVVFTASSVENLSDIYQMACDIAGGREALEAKPFIILYTEPQAPLIHPGDSLEKMLFAVEHGIPVIYSAATTAGQNGPVTLAGSVALAAARNLSGFAIAQLRSPGARMITTLHASSMDPRNASHTYASPEHVIGQGLSRDLLAHYGIPTFGRAGCTESKVLDQQAAFEAGYEILVQALCGENLIHDVGYMEAGMTSSLESLVMCHEFIGVAKRVVAGCEISEEALALDLIDQVGPEGHFMAEDHTVRRIRDEFRMPELFDRANFDAWMLEGGVPVGDRIEERIMHILANRQCEALDPSLLSRLRTLADKESHQS